MFGLSGDIAFYVTAELRGDGCWVEQSDTLHPTEGANLTYVPASSIKRVEVRFWTKVNGKAAEEELVAERVAAVEPAVSQSQGYKLDVAPSSQNPIA